MANDELTGLQAEEAYWAETEQLKLQHAGLELAIIIRQTIEQEFIRRRFRGGFHRKLRLHMKRPFRLMHADRVLYRTLAGKSIEEQEFIIGGLLDPYVRAGKIPAYGFSEGEKSDGTLYPVIECDYVMT